MLPSLGYNIEGIDVSPASAEICTAEGLKARAGDFLTEQFDGKFDLITMWDVVEHLRDPAMFLARARELLSDTGYLFARIPGFGEISVHLSSMIPRAAGTLLGAPEHVQ
ncbi:MAG: class I SAM-dependent methyltransferase [Sphingomicrobium sp.]